MLMRLSVSFCRASAHSLTNVQPLSTKPRPRISANDFLCKVRSSKHKEQGEDGSKNNAIPFILCNRQEFNHYHGQKYGKFDSIPLASTGWHHKRSRGDYFIIGNSKEHAESVKQTDITFSDAGISDDLIAELNLQCISKPTDIQARGIPAIMSGNNALLAAETGCGKTLAFLLPVLQQILTWKPLINNRSDHLNSPIGLIITPSRELAYQIADVARTLTANLPIACKVLIGGRTKSKMLHPEFNEVDLLVATLGALSKLTSTGVYNMSCVRHVVLDEADTLLDDSFSEKLRHFLHKFPFHFKGSEQLKKFPSGAQLTLVSATMPTSLPEALSEIILPESLFKVTTDRLHQFLPHVAQRFLRLTRSEKPSELLRILKSSTDTPTIVFSNKSSTCDWISLFLNENNINCINLNGDMPLLVRRGKFDEFKSGQVNVMSCTDIASRGLDTIHVQHIINYDFPLYTADYIHRCGRTGRVGSPSQCRVTNLITGPREVDLVQKIELAARQTNLLPNVNANISKVILDRITRNEKDSTKGK